MRRTRSAGDDSAATDMTKPDSAAGSEAVSQAAAAGSRPAAESASNLAAAVLVWAAQPTGAQFSAKSATTVAAAS